MRRHPRKLALALAQACAGHHFITYTRETVAPSLRRGLAEAGPGLAEPDDLRPREARSWA